MCTYQLEIVRREEDGRTGRVDRTEQLEDTLRRPLVEVARRLVRQYDERIVDQGSRDGDTLLLTTRHL
jgi:hypothetical protein